MHKNTRFRDPRIFAVIVYSGGILTGLADGGYLTGPFGRMVDTDRSNPDAALVRICQAQLGSGVRLQQVQQPLAFCTEQETEKLLPAPQGGRVNLNYAYLLQALSPTIMPGGSDKILDVRFRGEREIAENRRRVNNLFWHGLRRYQSSGSWPKTNGANPLVKTNFARLAAEQLAAMGIAETFLNTMSTFEPKGHYLAGRVHEALPTPGPAVAQAL